MREVASQESLVVLEPPNDAEVIRRSLCVKTTAWKHRGLEQRFEELSALLDGELAEVIQRFLAEHIQVSGR